MTPSAASRIPLLGLAGMMLLCLVLPGQADEKEKVFSLKQDSNTWVKRSPVKDGPVSPGMGYECSLVYDPVAQRVIRWAGHNQGGGGEQNAETWTFDPVTAKWELKEPNTSPPGVCCAQQNVFDPVGGRFLRFAGFSGNHGWQWFRELYLNNTSVWSYDLSKNTWRDLRTAPTPRSSSLRCASWDSEHQVAVIFGGENNQEGTVVFDPYTNTWTRMHPKPQPAFRSGGNMAYDAARKLHILFGAQFTDDPHTWAYDLRKNEWRDLKPAVQPPTNKNDAVLAYDSVNQVIVALVRVIDKEEKNEMVEGHLETWAFDAGKNTWTRMKSKDEPVGRGNRRRVMVAVPDQNVILMENYVNPAERVPGAEREQSIWTYRYAEAKPAAYPPPTDVQVTTTAKGEIHLSWRFSKPSSEVAGFHIYRGEGAQPWLAEFKRVGRVGLTAGHDYLDTEMKPKTIYHYFVRLVDNKGDKVADSVVVRTQPRIVEDAVVSVIGPKEVQLSWKPPASAEQGLGYHVERAVVEVFSEDQIQRLKKDTPPLADPSVGGIRAIGPFQRLTKEALPKPAFTDTRIDLSKPQAIEGDAIFIRRFAEDQLDPNGKPYRYAVYAYRIRSVNALGVESGPSPYFLTIPSAPQWLFSKEEGESCHLKWAANPEKGLKGYRVYRMNGPRINGPGQTVSRLTVDPLTELRYTDPTAGKDTQRYYVVTVDALGQEGFPSAPTWHYRQYRKYYEPFVGEWHQ